MDDTPFTSFTYPVTRRRLGLYPCRVNCATKVDSSELERRVLELVRVGERPVEGYRTFPHNISSGSSNSPGKMSKHLVPVDRDSGLPKDF